MKRLNIALAGALIILAQLAHAQPTEPEIEAAIQAGLKTKDSANVRPGNWAVANLSRTIFAVWMAGPLIRIQNAAAAAGKEFLPFTRAEVTDEMISDVLSVTAYPNTPRDRSYEPPRASRIVLQTKAKPVQTIQPQSNEPFPVEWANGFGATMSGQGTVATFNRSDLPSDDFFIVIVSQFKNPERFLVTKNQIGKVK